MHSEYTIRPITIEDALEASELWTMVFGDDERLVFEFYRLFSHQYGFGACAEKDGKLVAAAYCPEDVYYVEPDGTEHKGAYLYAVATHPDHRERGLAKEICQLLKDIAWSRDTEYIFTKPSEESLYAWYAEKLNAVPVMGCKTLRFTATDVPMLPYMQLLPDAYLELRTNFLAGKPHVRHSIWWLKWEQNLHDFNGGQFVAIGDYIADLYSSGDTLQVNEILPTPTDEAAAMVCNCLMALTGTSRCICTIPGDGEKYVSVMANNRPLPPKGAWFGPCYG